MNDYILEMKNIYKSFFGVPVLKDISLSVERGEVHVLLGENGAGKSTLIKILSGAYVKDSGSVYINGELADIENPSDGIDHGISVIYQEFNLVPHLSIMENILLGKEIRKGVFIDKQAGRKLALKHMERIGLNVNPDTLICDLSVAQRQMVEIAKALSNDSKVLVLDEPTAAITSTETEALFEIIRELKKEGLGIIYISHRLEELFEIGDRCTVLRDGEFVGTVTMAEITRDILTKMMVGRSISLARCQNRDYACDEVVLEVKNVSYKNLVKDVSFQLKRGEVLGVSGLVGSGRTELAKCILGAYKPDKGEVIIQGNSVKLGSIPVAISSGLVYLSEDRKDEGLIQIHNFVDNVLLPNYNCFDNFFLDKSKMDHAAEEMIPKLNIKVSDTRAPVRTLSGGNQQKVVIGKWLLSDASIFIFDEPTRGIDVGSREEIYDIMNKLLERGASIIMISSDLVEMLRMSHRVLVMSEGCLSKTLDCSDDVTQEVLLNYALAGGQYNG